jgi:hypothetical protein
MELFFFGKIGTPGIVGEKMTKFGYIGELRALDDMERNAY